MSLIEQIIQSKLHILHDHLVIVMNQQSTDNQNALYSIVVVGFIAVGIFFWNYKKRNLVNTPSKGSTENKI